MIRLGHTINGGVKDLSIGQLWSHQIVASEHEERVNR